MIPELQIPAQESALLIKPLGGPIVTLGHDRHLLHFLSLEPVHSRPHQFFSNAQAANLRADPDQTDLLPELSGLAAIGKRLEGLEDVAVVKLTDKDVVRHPLVGRMLSVL